MEPGWVRMGPSRTRVRPCLGSWTVLFSTKFKSRELIVFEVALKGRLPINYLAHDISYQ